MPNFFLSLSHGRSTKLSLEIWKTLRLWEIEFTALFAPSPPPPHPTTEIKLNASGVIPFPPNQRVNPILIMIGSRDSLCQFGLAKTITFENQSIAPYKTMLLILNRRAWFEMLRLYAGLLMNNGWWSPLDRVINIHLVGVFSPRGIS